MEQSDGDPFVPPLDHVDNDWGTSVSSLEPDTFAVVCSHLRHRDVAALAASCAALRHAVSSNDRLWAGLFSRQFPRPWQRLTRQGVTGGHGSGGAVPAGGWRSEFMQTHDACQQLRSTDPICREWTTDTTPVHLAAIHGSGSQRLTLAAQGSGVELRCAPPAAKSFQLYGHSARVSCAAVLRSGGGAVQRLGVVTGSHDQTVRLWAANADPESYEFRAQPLSLVTPLRTLRGHQESVTCLQLVSSGSTGVTIAATGGKDRVVRLWGLAPLVPSPVQKPQIATLRGHGAPVTSLVAAGPATAGASWQLDSDGNSHWGDGSTSASWLVSGSLDARVKSWDPWTAACTGTAKCAAPVAALAAPTAAPLLEPHTLFASGGAGVQLLDVRSMRAVGGAALPAGAELHCFAQWGWDLALGGGSGARVYDLRMLASSLSDDSSSGGSGGSGSTAGGPGGGGRGPLERLRVAERWRRPVTSIHIDRLKVVTGTDRYGEAPLRAWCPLTGECLAELGSCLPATPEADTAAGVADTHQAQLHGDETVAEMAAAAAGEGDFGHDRLDAEAVQQETQAQPQRQYHQDWEGVTALACRGALLVAGNSGGTVSERNFGHGGLPSSGEEPAGAGGAHTGKFWQHA